MSQGKSLSLMAARQMIEDQFGVGTFHAETMIEHVVEHGLLRLTATSLAEHGNPMRSFETDVIPPSIVQGAELDIETGTLHVAHGDFFGIATTFEDFYRVWPAVENHVRDNRRDRTGIGGRSFVADWPEYERLLRSEILQVGYPMKTGAPGWRTIADVCRWIAERLADDENPGPTTIRENVRVMLARIKSDGN